MDLLRETRRRVAGGTAVAVIVPVGIVLGSLGLGLSGGVGALSQALTGPEIPGVEPAAARSDGGRDEAGELLAAASSFPQRRALRVTGAGGSETQEPRRRRRAGRDRDRRPGAGPAPAAPQPPVTTAPPPQPDPTPPPSTVRQLGERVKEVTDRIPVAGEPAGQVVDIIVETAETLPLPEQPRP